jgi:hypothetical protein
MSCCTNTYNLGCHDHCGVISFGAAEVGGTYIGVFQSGNLSIKQSVIIAEGDPFMFDLSVLNEQSDYTLVIYHDGAQISVTIDEVEYDCFRVKTEILGVSTPSVMPTLCTPMCEEIYDPEQVGADVFDYNNLHTTAVGDGVTITGTGTTLDPFVAVAGGGAFDCGDLIGCSISNLTNDSGYITNAALAPYLTSATAAATYQPIGSYLTTISGLNISLLNNDSGYITSAALSGYVPTSRTLTINGVAFDLSADRTWTVSSSVRLNELLAANGANTIDNVSNLQTWTWNSLTSGTGLALSSSSTAATGNSQTVLCISQTGANATSGQTTYGLKVSNTKTGTTNSNTAALFTASGAANNNFAIEASGAVRMDDNQYFYFVTGVASPTTSAHIRTNTSAAQFQIHAASSQSINLISKIARGVLASDSSGVVYINLANNSSTKHSISFGGDNTGTTNYRAVDTTTAVIEQDGAKLHLCANSGLAGGFGSYTPNQIMTINGGATVAASNIGIGNTSPNASALLDLTSTTKGLLLPRMTATQGSAISALNGLMIYVTDTNGTFTSVGFWGYENGAWVKL